MSSRTRSSRTSPVRLVDLGAGVPVSRIVVPITLDHRYDRAMSLASRLAKLWHLPVELLCAASSDVVSPDVASPDSPGRRSATSALHAARDALAKSHPSLTVGDHLLAPDPIAGGAPSLDPMLTGAMSDYLRPSDLVVMASRAVGGQPRFSFAQSLAQRWEGPVLMAGPNFVSAEHVVGDVILGLDGSALAERLLPAALGLARAFDRRLHVVQVLAPEFVEHIERLKRRGESVSESAYVRDTVARAGDERTRWEIIHGTDPAQALNDFAVAQGASAIVVGTHGASGVVSSMFGGTAMNIVCTSKLPVLVQRPHAVGPPNELRSVTGSVTTG